MARANHATIETPRPRFAGAAKAPSNHQRAASSPRYRPHARSTLGSAAGRRQAAVTCRRRAPSRSPSARQTGTCSRAPVYPRPPSASFAAATTHSHRRGARRSLPACIQAWSACSASPARAADLFDAAGRNAKLGASLSWSALFLPRAQPHRRQRGTRASRAGAVNQPQLALGETEARCRPTRAAVQQSARLENAARESRRGGARRACATKPARPICSPCSNAERTALAAARANHPAQSRRQGSLAARWWRCPRSLRWAGAGRWRHGRLGRARI